MTTQKTFVNRAITGATVCTLIVACSSSKSSGSSTTVGADPTPSGTTAVTEAPYPVCTTLEAGSFVTANDAGASYTEPATTSCSNPGGPASGAADMHCQSEGNPCGTPPQVVNGADCSVGVDGNMAVPADDAGDAGGTAGDAGEVACPDAGAPAPGPCDENGTDGAYGTTMYGTEGDDDDCKYHVSYDVSPVCENNGTYFIVHATYQTAHPTVGAPLTGASTFAEVCLSNTHPGPAINARPPSGNQQVVEGPPGTYTVGPVQFDEPGMWTVRFHFNEFCCDVASDSPHGHAAFFVNVN